MKHWIQVIISFIFGQIGVQLLQIITGFLLIRWLTYEDYAVYSVVFSFQVIAITLTDLGISNSIIALVGKNVNEKLLVSRYIAVAYK
jgi:O-antigen/teichoic acid export membrane protein